MNRQQSKELFTLITTVRHVKEMDLNVGAVSSSSGLPGCLLCEGVRHGLYSKTEGYKLDIEMGFAPHFGCTVEEAASIIWHPSANYDNDKTTGENYYQAGKELLIKYGYGDLFEEAMPFNQLMESLNETIKWGGKTIPVTGVIS